MANTQLNLVAIAIFLMVMSALLGPVVNLSPAIPATVTLVVLGLVTADQLGWGGRGTDLVVALLQSRQERERILCHEAGHFLVAYCLGIPVLDYSLSPWEVFRQGQQGMAGVQFDTQELINHCRSWQQRPQALERWGTVWMAGIAAEKLVYGQAEGGHGDRQQLHIAFRRAGLTESNLPQKESWALLQAQGILERHQPAHQALQQALAERRSVADCYHLLDQHLTKTQPLGGGPNV